MRRSIWSKDAKADAREIFAYIADDNPRAAATVYQRIVHAARSLARHSTGRPGKLSGTYEKLVPRLPYILVYRVSEDTVTILRVIHTARDWP